MTEAEDTLTAVNAEVSVNAKTEDYESILAHAESIRTEKQLAESYSVSPHLLDAHAHRWWMSMQRDSGVKQQPKLVRRSSLRLGMKFSAYLYLYSHPYKE